MPLGSDEFDLGTLRLTAGEGRRLQLHVGIELFTLSGETYSVTPGVVPVRLDISRTVGAGYALRLRFAAALGGACMRCLQPALIDVEADATEIHQPAEGEELVSPYLEGAVLDLHAWARDALALAFPVKVLCRADCAGLCPVCGADLNTAGPEHAHERPPDPRWAKLSELRLE